MKLILQLSTIVIIISVTSEYYSRQFSDIRDSKKKKKKKRKDRKLSRQCRLHRSNSKAKGFQPLRISLSISLRIEIFPRNRIDQPRKEGGIYRPFRLWPSRCSSGIPFNRLTLPPPPVEFKPRAIWNAIERRKLNIWNPSPWLVLLRHVRIKEHPPRKMDTMLESRKKGRMKNEGGQGWKVGVKRFSHRRGTEWWLLDSLCALNFRSNSM